MLIMNIEMGRIILLNKKYPERGRNAASSVPQVSVNGVSINVGFVHVPLVLCNNFMPCS
jgi:hypothetical protein